MQRLQRNSKKIGLGFLIFLSGLFFAACYREPKFPDAPLNKEKMIAVLADIHLAESKIASMGNLSQLQRDSAADVYYATIFKIHGVKAGDFDISMNAYMQNPQELSAIYEKVLEKLQKDQSANLKNSKGK